MPLRHGLRHRPEPRGVTPRRLSAAAAALAREQRRLPLFSDQVIAEQETPKERIARFDQQQLDSDQARRDLAARHWRWGRAQLLALSDETRVAIVAAWNASSIPPTAAYFADFVRRELRRRDLLPPGE